jgi:biotin transport system substrate-specific component
VSARRTSPALLIGGIVFGAALVALGGRIVWPLPGSLAPVSMQTLALLMVAFAAGPLAATGAVVLYLAAAAAGLPVLANGASGTAVLLGPSGGYFIGFLLAPTVAVLSSLGGRGAMRAVRVLIGALLAHGLILIAGVVWLVLRGHHQSQAAINLALVPFIVPALIKSGILAVWVPLSERTGLVKV